MELDMGICAYYVCVKSITILWVRRRRMKYGQNGRKTNCQRAFEFQWKDGHWTRLEVTRRAQDGWSLFWTSNVSFLNFEATMSISISYLLQTKIWVSHKKSYLPWMYINFVNIWRSIGRWARDRQASQSSHENEHEACMYTSLHKGAKGAQQPKIRFWLLKLTKNRREKFFHRW